MTTPTATPSVGAKTAADVAILLRARNPLLWVVSREEQRVESFLVGAAEAARLEPVFWDCGVGATSFGGKQHPQYGTNTDPGKLLEAIRQSAKRQVIILRDFHAWLANPVNLRRLRNLVHDLPAADKNEARSIIILSPLSTIPPELQGEAIVLDWPLPDRQEVGDLLDRAVAELPDDLRASVASNGNRERAVDAALGLTALEAESCYAKSLVQTRTIDAAVVTAEKRRVITRSKTLEWVEPLKGGLNSVGGLGVLKPWLVEGKEGFSKDARAYGLPAPKGCLLVGVPGCGKSETAKAIAAAWEVPLLRLDLGGLKSKYVGESEQNIREALKVAETVAPCVLWIDELEKALAGGVGGGASDGGVSSDALGTILTWLQDKAGSVFVVATANDVTQLPPELLRKGRWDEVWFVDLPTAAERLEILRVTLRRFGRDLDNVVGQKDWRDIASETVAFSGAEVAALVTAALRAAFADGKREPTGADILKAAKETTPLAETAKEKITSLRDWAKGRARRASADDATESDRSGGRQLDL